MSVLGNKRNPAQTLNSAKIVDNLAEFFEVEPRESRALGPLSALGATVEITPVRRGVGWAAARLRLVLPSGDEVPIRIRVDDVADDNVGRLVVWTKTERWSESIWLPKGATNLDQLRAVGTQLVGLLGAARATAEGRQPSHWESLDDTQSLFVAGRNEKRELTQFGLAKTIRMEADRELFLLDSVHPKLRKAFKARFYAASREIRRGHSYWRENRAAMAESVPDAIYSQVLYGGRLNGRFLPRGLHRVRGSWSGSSVAKSYTLGGWEDLFGGLAALKFGGVEGSAQSARYLPGAAVAAVSSPTGMCAVINPPERRLIDRGRIVHRLSTRAVQVNAATGLLDAAVRSSNVDTDVDRFGEKQAEANAALQKEIAARRGIDSLNRIRIARNNLQALFPNRIRNHAAEKVFARGEVDEFAQHIDAWMRLYQSYGEIEKLAEDSDATRKEFSALAEAIAEHTKLMEKTSDLIEEYDLKPSNTVIEKKPLTWKEIFNILLKTPLIFAGVLAGGTVALGNAGLATIPITPVIGSALVQFTANSAVKRQEFSDANRELENQKVEFAHHQRSWRRVHEHAEGRAHSPEAEFQLAPRPKPRLRAHPWPYIRWALQLTPLKLLAAAPILGPDITRGLGVGFMTASGLQPWRMVAVDWQMRRSMNWVNDQNKLTRGKVGAGRLVNDIKLATHNIAGPEQSAAIIRSYTEQVVTATTNLSRFYHGLGSELCQPPVSYWLDKDHNFQRIWEAIRQKGNANLRRWFHELVATTDLTSEGFHGLMTRKIAGYQTELEVNEKTAVRNRQLAESVLTRVADKLAPEFQLPTLLPGEPTNIAAESRLACALARLEDTDDTFALFAIDVAAKSCRFSGRAKHPREANRTDQLAANLHAVIDVMLSDQTRLEEERDLVPALEPQPFARTPIAAHTEFRQQITHDTQRYEESLLKRIPEQWIPEARHQQVADVLAKEYAEESRILADAEFTYQQMCAYLPAELRKIEILGHQGTALDEKIMRGAKAILALPTDDGEFRLAAAALAAAVRYYEKYEFVPSHPLGGTSLTLSALLAHEDSFLDLLEHAGDVATGSVTRIRAGGELLAHPANSNHKRRSTKKTARFIVANLRQADELTADPHAAETGIWDTYVDGIVAEMREEHLRAQADDEKTSPSFQLPLPDLADADQAAILAALRANPEQSVPDWPSSVAARVKTSKSTLRQEWRALLSTSGVQLTVREEAHGSRLLAVSTDTYDFRAAPSTQRAALLRLKSHRGRTTITPVMFNPALPTCEQTRKGIAQILPSRRRA
ncbi:MAG: hypothetical protein HOQ05_13885 [Corynebacteriales bacterium]|nr:hypothetical protein [Mycobacteriales bacterium]